MITLLRGMKISAVYSFVSLQSMRVTDGQTDRQNSDPQDRAIIGLAASRGKNATVTGRGNIRQIVANVPRLN